MKQDGLRFGPLGSDAVHLCIDLQRMFAPGAPWETPWLTRIRPTVHTLCKAHPDRTIFTRFIPPYRAEQANGSWRRYYEKWSEVTGQRADPMLVELLPEFAALVPPALVLDKPCYSPFFDSDLDRILKRRDTTTLILTGTETDVCVLAAALDAVDRGYRTIIAQDAVCSSADTTHDALMQLYHRRFSQQIETVDTAEILANWR